MAGNSPQFVLGSDIGTGSCKTVLLDAAGRVVAAADQAYPTRQPQPGWAEQDPEAWYAAFCRTTRRALTDSAIQAGQIVAVCIAGVTHNPVLLDADGRLLRPAIHFWDKRSVAQAAQIQEKWGSEVRRRALNDVDPLWTWPQLLWLRQNEPDVWRRIAALQFPKDYVRQRLGQGRPEGRGLSDTIDPAGTLLYDPRRREWIADFVADLGLPLSALPIPHRTLAFVDRVGRPGARECGLLAGTPIIAGATDTAAEVLGAGALRPGQAIVKLASVGRLMLVMDRPLDQPHSLNYPHVLDGLWYPGSVTKHGAGAYRWARQALWPDAPAGHPYRAMDRAAAMVNPGCDGLVFLPHLSGEYAPQWDPELRASFVGLTTAHRREHLTRAVLEGVAMQIRAALGQIVAAGGRYDEVRLIGGGANSALWAQIMADVLNRDLLAPVERSAAYGAGLLAGMAAGLYPPEPAELAPLIRLQAPYRPQPETAAFYRHLFDLYLEASRSLTPVVHRLERLDISTKSTSTIEGVANTTESPTFSIEQSEVYDG
ncbi:MAG: xylulokinase [Candidatus Promineifilaceae bacterium]